MGRTQIGTLAQNTTDAAAIAALSSRLTADETTLNDSAAIAALAARVTTDETTLNDSAAIATLSTQVNSLIKIQQVTAAAYAAITTPDPNILYVVVG